MCLGDWEEDFDGGGFLGRVGFGDGFGDGFEGGMLGRF